MQKRYRWTNEQSSLIAKLFWQKCATRTKDKLSKDRSNAIRLAGDAHPGQGVEYMHEYNPWWCSADVWSQMCDQWRDPIWLKRRKTAAENRAAGVPDGEKAKGTYKGGSISQLAHLVARV